MQLCSYDEHVLAAWSRRAPRYGAPRSGSGERLVSLCLAHWGLFALRNGCSFVGRRQWNAMDANRILDSRLFPRRGCVVLCEPVSWSELRRKDSLELHVKKAHPAECRLAQLSRRIEQLLIVQPVASGPDTIRAFQGPSCFSRQAEALSAMPAPCEALRCFSNKDQQPAIPHVSPSLSIPTSDLLPLDSTDTTTSKQSPRLMDAV